MYGHPGNKLLFMGCDIGQYEEWNHDSAVRWELLNFDYHKKLQALVRELNALHRDEPALHEVDFHQTGFEWIDFHDVESSVISFLRRSMRPDDFLVFCCNFTPLPRTGYRFGVPARGFYREILNTDSEMFGGSNVGNGGGVTAEPIKQHGRDHSITVTIPPLGVVVFKPVN
jgi:1,4-alpha-glucan branching enzyme